MYIILLAIFLIIMVLVVNSALKTSTRGVKLFFSICGICVLVISSLFVFSAFYSKINLIGLIILFIGFSVILFLIIKGGYKG